MNRTRITALVESKRFHQLIITAIILNALTLGLETAPKLVGGAMPVLLALDTVFLALFTVEIILKLVAYRLAFFKSGWNSFDFVIVAISLTPFIPSLSILRALRVLRVLRLISAVPQFRKVTQAFFDSLAGLAVIGCILSLLFFVGAVVVTKLFGEAFPAWFGSIGASLFSLFQIMTLESWSMGIVRPVMQDYPYAWLFFVPFILLTTFVALNLLIGVIVNSMQILHSDAPDAKTQKPDADGLDRDQLKAKITEIESALQALKRKL